MPLYDYRCTACGQVVEVMHGIDGNGPDACQSCGGAMRKALSTPAIHFKGSGWAKKDAAAASASKAKPKTESSAPADSSADGKAGSEDAASGTSGKSSGGSEAATPKSSTGSTDSKPGKSG